MTTLHGIFLRLYLWWLRASIILAKEQIALAQESIRYDERRIRETEM